MSRPGRVSRLSRVTRVTRVRRVRRVRPWLRALTLRTLALFALAIVASILFAVIAAEMRAGALDHLDRVVELAIHRLDAAPVDAAMTAATRIGSNLVLLPVVAAVTALAIRLRQRAVAIILVIDAIVVIAAYSALKLMFSRERPRLFDKIALPTGYSFPSGHSMSAVGIYGVIAAVLIALYPGRAAPVIVSAVLLIAAIGASRIYLGVHWPSDVIGGFLGGVPPLAVSVHLIHRRRTRDRNLADVVDAAGAPDSQREHPAAVSRRRGRARRRRPSRPAGGGGAADRAGPRSASTPPGRRRGSTGSR